MTTRHGFTLCICPDGKLLRQQIEELLAVVPGTDPWERHVFWGDEDLPRTFWELLTLQGLFATPRALIVRNAHNLPADIWKRLSPALAHPNPLTWPLFCMEGSWEKGQPKILAHIAKLSCYAFADKKGWIWRSPGLDGRSLRRYIQSQAKTLGLTLAPGSIEALIEGLPQDAAAVDNELEKLSLLVGNTPLTPELARSVSHTAAFNVFTFLRQLQAGQAAHVWKSVLEEQRKGEEPLFYLLAMLQREARQLWQLLAGEQLRMAPADLTAKQQTATRLGVTGLAKVWDAMHTAELAVKSGRRSPAQALDGLMGELTLLFARPQRSAPVRSDATRT
ncbi:MAG: DNA polymerase III subunit delta [Bilophila sp.]